MRNIALTIEYDGSAYCGWQTQKAQKTVQETIEAALKKILRHPVHLVASGRTDTGVHARAQVANFKTTSVLSVEKLKKGFNAVLPVDITIRDCREMALDFNARFDALWKHYRYTIYSGSRRPVIGRQYVLYVPYVLDVKAMKQEAKELLGKKNFRSFHASGRQVKDCTRCIRRLDIVKDKNNRIIIDIEADGFLYNMVRNIVGTLIEVGRGKMPQGSAGRILKACDRKKAGPTAPARGLCLMSVTY